MFVRECKCEVEIPCKYMSSDNYFVIRVSFAFPLAAPFCCDVAVS